jgi:hypothetical protein
MITLIKLDAHAVEWHSLGPLKSNRSASLEQPVLGNQLFHHTRLGSAL